MVSCLLRPQVQLWCSPDYTKLRERLAKPIVAPHVKDHGTFCSVVTEEGGAATTVDFGLPVGDDNARGVIHVVPFQKGSPMPADLKSLDCKLVLLELPEDNSDVHPYLVTLVRGRKILMVYGSRRDVSAAFSVVNLQLEGEGVRCDMVDIYLPNTENISKLYYFTAQALGFIALIPLPFGVCQLSPSPSPTWLSGESVAILSREPATPSLCPSPAAAPDDRLQGLAARLPGASCGGLGDGSDQDGGVCLGAGGFALACHGGRTGDEGAPGHQRDPRCDGCRGDRATEQVAHRCSGAIAEGLRHHRVA